MELFILFNYPGVDQRNIVWNFILFASEGQGIHPLLLVLRSSGFSGAKED